MSKEYLAANGMKFTDEMIDAWCQAYDRGEFPVGEHSVGKAINGRPPAASEKTTTLTVKLPAGLKAAIMRKAKQDGISAGAYVRSLVAKDLL